VVIHIRKESSLRDTYILLIELFALIQSGSEEEADVSGKWGNK
jgi:hypothetical protein